MKKKQAYVIRQKEIKRNEYSLVSNNGLLFMDEKRLIS